MSKLTLEQANTIVAKSLKKGNELGLNPLTVAVVDDGGMWRSRAGRRLPGHVYDGFRTCGARPGRLEPARVGVRLIINTRLDCIELPSGRRTHRGCVVTVPRGEPLRQAKTFTVGYSFPNMTSCHLV